MAKDKIWKTPGVYIEEIKFLPAPITPVATAIPAFVGFTQKDETNGVPTVINSVFELENLFGKASSTDLLVKVIDETTDPVTIKITTEGDRLFNSYLYYSIQLFFQNGGKKCYVVSAGLDQSPVSKDALISGLKKLEKINECTLLIVPDAVLLPNEDCFEVCNAILDQCYQLRDRFAILDVKTDTNASVSAVENFREGIQQEVVKLQFGAAYFPYIQTNLSLSFLDEAITEEDSELTLSDLKENSPAQYQKIRKALVALPIILPLSGAIAGVYAAVDVGKGVWKAPANIALNSVVRAAVSLSSREQETLNVDATNGKSINAIRTFTGKGTLVWGARTLAGNDNEWRYISVRRFFIMVEESVKRGLGAYVFEPNDAATWVKVRGVIENFLYQLWRDGALMGAKPEEAFYVKVGLGHTMTQNDILNGDLIVEIGIAAVRPAEFIILRIHQKMQQP